MSDFTEGSRTAPQEGNPFRPYVDTLGGRHNDNLYEELKNPANNLRNLTSGGAFSEDPYRLSGSEGGGIAGLEEFDVNGLEYDSHVDTAQYAKDLLRFAGYRYLATLASSPFTIAQTLLQVQYLPAAVLQSEPSKSSSDETQDKLDEVGDIVDPDDLAYYDYLRARHSERGTQYKPAERAHVDHDGYVVSTHEKGVGEFKPGYQLDALPTAKLKVFQKLLTHPTEGFLSMFKGCFTQWVYDILYLLVQPTLEVVLNEMLGVYDSAPLYTYIDAAAPSALTVVASNLIVGWVLSPLELVRTRLIIQSASPIHRKYHGTFHALKTIAKEEGGVWSMYFSPYHLVPTVIRHTMDPIFRNMGAFALDRVYGIDPYDHPTTFAFGNLLWKTIAATVMLPIDTIRTRLQAQPRYANKATAGSTRLSATSGFKSDSKAASKNEKQARSFKEFRTCVPISPIPYTGMVNCAWRIITEEGESLKKMKKRRAASVSASTSGNTEKPAQISNVGHYGLRGLYPGFTLQLAANVAIFGLSFISTDEIEFA
ncbi:hypothetical protein IW140_002457 [Coemansia sp. RSA 1813]|nr:hypothetical protein EV178_000958 [Coemansia sp. RSA 1646]KAJ1773061.1 hypothetical protein LPJ74_001012 [Coemansia sp. RSA 1843]KAJ2092163.1 hypothetical protein IW138_001230 [Coemansia sp. RSA 986]KAJ2215299.1 hypothetical protein EV179_002247 [Coemansia sp. RSA 487]KAJ2570364.1 hypothetical protein IW140_002457 [Coemansia sp. RSA 1813]